MILRVLVKKMIKGVLLIEQTIQKGVKGDFFFIYKRVKQLKCKHLASRTVVEILQGWQNFK